MHGSNDSYIALTDETTLFVLVVPKYRICPTSAKKSRISTAFHDPPTVKHLARRV